jgi:hypothetical protein
MRRTLTVVGIVAIAVLMIATPGLAAARGGNGGGNGGNGGGRSGGQGTAWFNLYGTIDALGASAKTIEVTVLSPLNLTRYNPLTVQTTTDTRFR